MPVLDRKKTYLPRGDWSNQDAYEMLNDAVEPHRDKLRKKYLKSIEETGKAPSFDGYLGWLKSYKPS